MQNDLGSQLYLKSEEHVCVVFYYKYIFALRYISRLKIHYKVPVFVMYHKMHGGW